MRISIQACIEGGNASKVITRLRGLKCQNEIRLQKRDQGVVPVPEVTDPHGGVDKNGPHQECVTGRATTTAGTTGTGTA